MVQELLDLVIVGAGPAGIGAAARARANGLSFLLLERTDHLADTVFRYQKNKHVMAEPGQIPLRSDLSFEAGTREAVLERWDAFVGKSGIDIRFEAEMTGLEKTPDGFEIATAAGEAFRSRNVVLAVGTQGNPRKLGVPGEELPHVATRLIDAADHEDEDIVVIGAGDSALEVALALCERNRVHLIVRKPEIVRAKEALERGILGRAAAGEIDLHFSTTVGRIEAEEIELQGPDGIERVPCGRVFLQIGAVPPRAFLEGVGVVFTGTSGDAQPVLDERYQSSVPGLYLIGAVGGRDLIKLGLNQGYEVVEYIAGNEIEPADEEILRARLPHWPGSVSARIEKLRNEIPLLALAGPEHLREMFFSAEVRNYAEGEVILHRNDYTDSFLVIAGGLVAISMRAEGAAEDRLVATLGEGNFFGEMSLISGRRRNATATAASPARLIEIPRKAMLKLLAMCPEVKRRVDEAFLVRAFQSYLFPDVEAGDLAELVARAEVLELMKNETVFSEGDEGDAFYLIRSGKVKVSRVSGDRERTLTYLVSGNFFGEAALHTAGRRVASVTTIFPTELIRLSRDHFEEFLAEQPELRPRFTDILEKRRIEALLFEATPGAGEVLSNLIQQEVVMGTDVLIIDNHKCVRCDNCIHACEGVHDDGQARLSLTGRQFYNLLAPNSCWQCEDPLCMLDCPPDAIVRDAGGEIVIKSNCIGCGHCEENCPYGNIFMVHPRPRNGGFGRLKSLLGVQAPEIDSQVAVKCDLCRGIEGGPACVRSCPTGAALRLGPDEQRQAVEELVVRGAEAGGEL